MLRREARLRREYLYRKSLEEKQHTINEKKQQLKEALESNKKIRTELKHEASELTNELLLDSNFQQTSHEDDEYANAGVKDPKILVTTSRDPSSKLTQFCKEMKLVFPNSQRMNRGNYVMKDIVQACKGNDVSDLIILHEHRGVPNGMIVSHFPHGPTAFFSLHNVVLRHDIPECSTVSEAFPQLIFDKFQTKLGLRLQNILKHLFPVPKEDSKRVLTFRNDQDFVSFRHHVFSKTWKEAEITEVGPRFEMKLYELRMGTVDIEEADKEWVYRPFMNTSKKRDFI